ncbi:RNA polymerase sigma-70 factor (ECF subfamily) [Parabacteroides sp. PF5-5]|uniref:RNA polymerase sigma factor n=1 Tax=unclassified Parabacteroides TaxID=2649774 RepID=UPI0024749744|nr:MULTISPECIES: RNA polymerase sigma factor [unclassified Parabacteroides]MDH6305973.1 RNA polymerase sigma-70 factor (ECF subfamily) [Parabacteroides sp. PH5-39]MDH6317229.1 RNA polymerase sigma-70 factor (ECF subfamily) [Parabacteroides sp. PF5-13]MDH6320685.1 RNA polymerase sigma-70 factor (ECF subfamily) [Parabacteroides sp. PH5-13]MDH6324394.1 RNA polymerase sigma-70 factor (ECF subfamily) [Parabacteroides sp. PH5-8]MDH6328414.1 RNA polymerase sigma-70 factor (ECF subfamily) [Parabactero
MDAESFKQLYLPLHPRLYRIAYALTGNSQDAEDILQDAYCKLWSKRKEISEIRNTEAFCVTLVKNLCYDFLRSPRSRQSEEIVESLSMATGASPETEAIEQDEIRLIQQLIDKLPENQRQVIRLKGIKDCSLEEIEEITGLSAVNVRVLLSRARKIIREQYFKLASYG